MLDLTRAMARGRDLNFSTVDFARRRCEAVTCSVFGSVFCSSSSLMSQRGTQVWAWWTISPLHPRKDPIHEEEKKKIQLRLHSAQQNWKICCFAARQHAFRILHFCGASAFHHLFSAWLLVELCDILKYICCIKGLKITLFSQAQTKENLSQSSCVKLDIINEKAADLAISSALADAWPRYWC